MNLMEAGIISGVPAGTIVGGVVGSAPGARSVIAGLLIGAIAGGFAGLLYSYFVMFALSVVGAIWGAAQKRGDTTPTEAEFKLMTPIGIRGIILGTFTALFCWTYFGWLPAVAAAAAVGLATAVIAVARCELAKTPKQTSEQQP